MANSNFKCPYCGQPTTITDPNRFVDWNHISIAKHSKGDLGITILAITCPNPKCNNLWLKVVLTRAVFNGYWESGPAIDDWQLLPESEAKVLPDYIPVAIKKSYLQACRIRDLSPEASATLSRRCLQGMIRDFWNIKKPKLNEEIIALEKVVDKLTWDAIDSVRKVGNIGAHMEKDIDLIIDVEPKEAQLLIELIEQLIDDWYVERHEKEQRLLIIKKIADNKDEKRKKK